MEMSEDIISPGSESELSLLEMSMMLEDRRNMDGTGLGDSRKYGHPYERNIRTVLKRSMEKMMTEKLAERECRIILAIRDNARRRTIGPTTTTIKRAAMAPAEPTQYRTDMGHHHSNRSRCRQLLSHPNKEKEKRDRKPASRASARRPVGDNKGLNSIPLGEDNWQPSDRDIDNQVPNST
ncbi:hypothetical protein C7212DRAFT_342099 [Tuber magnatum]|uniref:Uncharacterized protein n=1 Tax=Tuber magnatum TaxID=42249 RepID=A0A317T3Q1_9PEZI|nr:hypothetical protein C7212DRAFT_342099 [Tuber magnatum]